MRTPRSTRVARIPAGLLLATTLVLTGCAAEDDSADSGRAAVDEAARSDAKGSAPQAGAGPVTGSGRTRSTAAPAEVIATHIIRTASLTVRVKDVSKALDTARGSAQDAGGYVGDETTTRDGKGHEHTSVVLRVPVDRYAEVLTDVEGSGTLIERSAKAQDVTDQVVDVDSRVRSQRASVARIRELMDRATELSEVVTLESELSSRQSDLESLLAQQASLKDRTGLATISLTLSETPAKKPAPKKEEDRPGFLDALAGGWDALLMMLRWIALVLGAVLPFAVLAALIFPLWRKVVGPRLRRRRATASTIGGPGPVPTPRPAPNHAPSGE